jgi:Low-density lipoprotein receptor domain class A
MKSGKCIPWSKRCDGISDDCFDQTNLDEFNCGSKSGALASCAPLLQRIKGWFSDCGSGKFHCTRSGSSPFETSCVELSSRCNGVRDCPNGEDELNCSK